MRFCSEYLKAAAFFAFGSLTVFPAYGGDLPRLPPVPSWQSEKLQSEKRPARFEAFEARFGVFSHDPLGKEEGSVDINGELLAPLPFDMSSLPEWLIPRAHIGFSANTSGKTSHAYIGLSWSYDVTERFFIEASFGGAIHNGNTSERAEPGRNCLGCSPLFRESLSIGYRFTHNWNVMATIEHLSNAGLCSENRGLTNAGIRLSYLF